MNEERWGSRTVAPSRMVIRNGDVFDAETGITRGDVYLDGGRVVPPFAVDDADSVVDAGGRLVSPGWVDMHTHVFRGKMGGIEPDPFGARTGVTTMIDAGTAGAMYFGAFEETTLLSAATRIRAFLNISSLGTTNTLEMAGELSHMPYVSESACLDRVRRSPEHIVGVKVRASQNVGGDNVLEALRRARRVSDESGLPLMVHVGPAPAPMAEVLKIMRGGDIITHCFSGQTDVPLASVAGEPDLLAEAEAARGRGVLFDVGHGMGSFDGRRVRAAIEAGLLPDSISTDLWCSTAQGVLDDGLPHVASKMLALGMTLEDVLERVTARPAAAVGLDREGVGSLRPGSPADLVILDVVDGEYAYEDTTGYIFHGERSLRPSLVIRRGEICFDRSADVA